MKDKQVSIKKLALIPVSFIGKPYGEKLLLINSLLTTIILSFSVAIDKKILITIPTLLLLQNLLLYRANYEKNLKNSKSAIFFAVYSLILALGTYLLLLINVIPLLAASLLTTTLILFKHNQKIKRGRNRKPNSHYNSDGSSKKEYQTFKDALLASKRYQERHGKEMRPYNCSDGNHFHIGSVKK
ncbi:MAG: hypothetical protein ACKOW9_03070 [Candidatus Paceibacterota bacterium]